METLSGQSQKQRYTILRLSHVKEKTRLSRSTIYKWIAAGNFPKQLNLGGRSVGWLESDIDEWIRTKIEINMRN